MLRTLSAVFLLSMGLYVSAQAASLRYPLIIDGPILTKQLSSINDDLKTAGSQLQFPEYIFLGSRGHAQAHLGRILEQAGHAAVVLGNDVSPLIGDSLATYTKDELNYPLCYGGDPADAVDVIESLIGTGFSELTLIFAWRHKTTTQMMPGYENFLSEANARLENEWPDYDSANDGILIIYSDNAIGDNITSALVPHCQ